MIDCMMISLIYLVSHFVTHARVLFEKCQPADVIYVVLFAVLLLANRYIVAFVVRHRIRRQLPPTMHFILLGQDMDGLLHLLPKYVRIERRFSLAWKAGALMCV